MISESGPTEYDRSHILKYCRERCIDEGYYGRALNDCIEECIKSATR
ncbi:MAG: hypothetical protein N3D82_02915 [Ignisphaera sp.]|nr:hypothetical protein [Ignisphaera sp.]MCX8167967.1 hypothetical protein [Ignisphaera sp.]MDW8085564.1 hypothetical protein [Ignisphaera sp.]